MTMAAIGPFNGMLPEPSGMIIGFMLDPTRFKYLAYTQMVPAPEIQFMYASINSDDSARLTDLNKFAWGYDDFRPSGRGFSVQAEWLHDRVNRYDFPYTVGNETIRQWGRAGINVRALFDDVRAGHAALHRASRVVSTLTGSDWTGRTATIQDLTGEAGVDFLDSTGQDLDSASLPLPNFGIIRKTFNAVKRRIHLATNGAASAYRKELFCVMSPEVAKAIGESGEMFEALKQYQRGPQLNMDTFPGAANVADWNLPPTYADFNIVVEDTPRVFINQNAAGTVADVTVASEKDYILTGDDIYFVSRPGGFQGVAGGKSFSTLQCWHWKGEARIEAFSDPKNDLVEGHVVLEDKVLSPTLVGAFRVTSVLDA